MPVAGNRGTTAARYALEIGGASAGLVQSFAGGDAYADVVSQRSGTDNLVRKHLGAVHYDDIVLACGPAAGKPLYQWLSATLAGQPTREDGAVATADATGKQLSRLEFSQALISAIAFPALDAASKAAAALTVSISPEVTRLKPGAGTVPKAAGPAQKKWLASSFRLTVGELDCRKVSKVAPLVVRQRLSEHASGGGRDAELTPAWLDLPDLVVTLADSSAKPWRDWHQSFVIDGRNGRADEKDGLLELLAPDRKTVLVTLRLHGLGIYRLTPEKVEAGSENVRRVTASMYCQGIELFLGPAPKEPRSPAAATRRSSPPARRAPSA